MAARSEGIREPANKTWDDIAPLLDDAMDELEESTRAALVLRYFDGLSLKEVAERLNITHDAARQRVSRAVAHLRDLFAKRGIKVTALGVATLIGANAVHAAPASLAAATIAVATSAAVVTATATGSVATITTTTTVMKGALTIMAWTKAKVAAACIAALSLVGGTTAIIVQQVAEPDGERITIDSSADAVLVNAAPRTITGTVKTPDGKPVAGAEVRLQRGAGPVRFTTSISPDGAVRSERVVRKLIDAPADPSTPQVLPFRTGSGDGGAFVEDLDVRVAAPREGRGTILLGRAAAAAPNPPPGISLEFSSDGAVVKTGADGTFTFETTDSVGQIIAQSEAGIAEVPFDQLTQHHDVVLQPWAKLEGTLNHGDKPLASHTVTLTRGAFHRDQRQVHTDDEGRFSFDHVPPGPALLTHSVPGADAAAKSLLPVAIKPGETLTLELGRTGRDVKGRVVIPTTQPSTSTQTSLVGTLRRTDANDSAPSAFPDARTTFPVAPDGSFALDHLWPGTYTLSVTRHQRSPTSLRAIPSTPVSFTITDQDPATPLDLGTLQWTTTPAPGDRRAK